MSRASLIYVAGTSLGGALMFASALLFIGAGPGQARDHGQLGQTFPIIEPDLLATIEARLMRAQATGEIDRVNAGMAKRADARVRRPDPVPGISAAEESRSWTFDPAITLDHDVRDRKGQLIAAAGQRINPLDFVAMREDLVFVNGDDRRQLDWATARFGDLKAKIIFVSGSPLEAMTARKRRFFFDQQGKLTERFGIRHTPAVVRQAGKVLRVTETALGQGRAR